MMMIKHALLFVFIIGYLIVSAQTITDPKATKETKALYSNLFNLNKKYLVGHQDALAYGVKWKYVPGGSDIKGITGDHPAVYGWELGGIEKGRALNLDSVPFDKMIGFIQEGYRRGGIITISWHGDNPLTGKSAWDASPGAVAAVLPGGTKHEAFVNQLNAVAGFLARLKGDKGEAIPVLFRPFHEITGDWFWWGTKGNSPDELKEVFRFTVDYLRNKKQLHNLITVYNTSNKLKSAEEFLERYPGDEYVDMVSFDSYQRGAPDSKKSFIKGLEKDLRILNSVAKDRKKLAALAELGYNQLPDPTWFTKTVQPVLRRHPIAYVLFWRNAGYKPIEKEVEFYIPYPGHPAAQDFLNYYRTPETLFQEEARNLNLYKD